MNDLGPLRGEAIIPRVDGSYTGAVKISGFSHVAVITRDGDGIRLRIFDGPQTPISAEDQAEHDAWLDRNTTLRTG